MTYERTCFLLGLLTLFVFSKFICASLISSSEVQLCQRSSQSFDPVLERGDACQKKFLIALAVRNGQGESDSIYADVKTVDNKTTSGTRKELLKKPFRISVTKSDVYIHYPVQYLTAGYCCYSTKSERHSKAWEYKRGIKKKVGHYFSHKYSIATCMRFDQLWYNVFIINDPYLTYKINVTVQQLEYQRINTTGMLESVWITIGNAEIGPQRIGQNTAQDQDGQTSGPMIKAIWQGDFSMNQHLAVFDSKYLLTPDWRASIYPHITKVHRQVTAGSQQWLIVDRHLVDDSDSRCNKIGSGKNSFIGQVNRCYQKEDSCFKVTPRTIWTEANRLQNLELPTHYFASFYGDFKGPHSAEENNDLVSVNESSPDNSSSFQLVYKSHQIHKSLITLTFTAESVTFVENRSEGRIVEAMINDFSAIAGSGTLLVIVQNTGKVTADYSVTISRCSEGIIKVSQQAETIDPRHQLPFAFQISSSLNLDYNHSCYVELLDKDNKLLDIKKVEFKTEEGCIYCPANQCTCDCERQIDEENEKEKKCKKEQDEYLNPFWTPDVIVIKPCYHCWITNSFKNPVLLSFMTVIFLLSIGMIKMLIAQSCCRTTDGRPIDVTGIILGTTNRAHTKRKQRTATIQFLLGACFFVYLPFLPLMIIFCNWRRRRWAKKRLIRKAFRKKQRLLKKKQAALEAMQGLITLEDDITVDDALMVFETETNKPTVLVVSSSSDTDEQDFDYSTNSDDNLQDTFGEVEENKSSMNIDHSKTH